MQATVEQILAGSRRDVEAISAIGAPGRTSSVAQEIEDELLEAQRNLARRLRREAALHGGMDARFTGASALSYERQIRLSLEYLRARMTGLTEAQATAAIATGVSRTVTELEALEQRFTGITRPLRLREANRMRATVQGAQSTLLAHIPTSVDRYGSAMTAQFERIMRVGMMQGSTMDEMVAALTGHGGPTGRVSMAATVTPNGVLRLVESDIPEGLFVRHRSWAERIVRTEVIRSYNGARLEGLHAAQQEDFPDLQKKIVAILDRRTAPDSIAVDGQVRKLGEPFVDGAGRVYQYPPARPNDRETVIPWRPDWNESAGRASRADREELGESTQDERTAIVNRMRAAAGEPPLPPARPATAPRGPAGATPPARRPVPATAPTGAAGRPRLPPVPRVATQAEVVQLQGARNPRGQLMTVEAAQRRARETVARIRRTRDASAAQRQAAEADYPRARALGASMGRTSQLVPPAPTGDMEPMQRMLGQARGNVADLNRMMTGRTIPLGRWEPVQPLRMERTGTGPWSLEDGHKRLRAAVDAGATEVRVRMVERDERGRVVRDEVAVLPV